MVSDDNWVLNSSEEHSECVLFTESTEVSFGIPWNVLLTRMVTFQTGRGKQLLLVWWPFWYLHWYDWLGGMQTQLTGREVAVFTACYICCNKYSQHTQTVNWFTRGLFLYTYTHALTHTHTSACFCEGEWQRWDSIRCRWIEMCEALLTENRAQQDTIHTSLSLMAVCPLHWMTRMKGSLWQWVSGL